MDRYRPFTGGVCFIFTVTFGSFFLNWKQVAYLVRLGGAGTGLPLVLVARRIWTELFERLVITLLPPVPDRL